MTYSHDILTSPTIASLMFYPRDDQVPHPFWVQSEGARLCCHYEEKIKDGPVIVFFHGNGETAGDYAPNFPDIMEAIGFNIFLAEYRGYGGSDGAPNLRNFLIDAAAIMKALPSPARKVVLFGRSLGCLQAIHAASLVADVHGLILEGGIANVGEYTVRRSLYGSLKTEHLRSSVDAIFNHKFKLSQFRGRGLVVCGADDFMHRDESRQLYDWLKGPKFFRVFKRGGHNSVFFENVHEYCELIASIMGQGKEWQTT